MIKTPSKLRIENVETEKVSYVKKKLTENFVLIGEIFFLLLCWVEIHCGIYKGSYSLSNISYLNSPPQVLSITFPPLIFGAW
jgi:hypothetical protein